MIKFSYGLAATLWGTTSIVVVQSQQVLAQSSAQVANTAKQITVLIEGQAPGSGVIIKREGNTYTVLTTRHVVATRDEYDIVTPDGQKYRLNYSTVKPLGNVDLAVLEFTSTQNYPVARLGNSRAATSGTAVYVAGFPVPTAAINQRIFNFTEGKMTANADRPLADGYALVYSNNTLPGMSGGPVLNSAGEVIGIHGKGDTDTTSAKASGNPNVVLKTWFNLAIPINTFLSLAGRAGTVGFAAPPPTPVSAQPTADDLFLQAGAKYKRQDYRGEIADYDQALSIDPDNAAAYHNRGVAREKLRDFQGAIADYDQALRINPNSAAAYFNRGNARSALGDYQGAIADYDQALRINPNFTLAYNNRGLARSDLSDNQGAIADYDQALRINPNDAVAYFNRGNARYYDLGDSQGALADYNQFLRISPNNAIAYALRGLARSGLGDKQGAIADLQRAAQLAQAQGNMQAYEIVINNLRILQR
jgi:tetratricopeptide (TPR) repeat protein